MKQKCQIFVLCIYFFSLLIGVNTNKESVILKYENEPFVGQNGYNYHYTTSNHIEARQTGILDENGENLRVSGFYTYLDPSGNTQKVYYKADSLGFRVTPIATVNDVQKTSFPNMGISGRPEIRNRFEQRQFNFGIPSASVFGMVGQTRIATNVLATLSGGGIG